MADSTLYGHPELYDLVISPDPLAEAFYLEEARRRGGAVLELASGTGRFLIPLAQAGMAVVGVDLSSAMAQHARQKAARAGVRLEIVKTDMRDFDFGQRRFGTIMVAGNSLLHLHDNEDIIRCFRSAVRHLAPGGALIFDVYNPSVRLLARDPAQRHLVRQLVHERLGELTLEETSDYDAASQINSVTWYWSTPGKPDFIVMPIQLRPLFARELPLLVECGGFRLAARYGNFDRGAFGRDSPRQICICEPLS
jgi:SAM-dependent methyltransferase